MNRPSSSQGHEGSSPSSRLRICFQFYVDFVLCGFWSVLSLSLLFYVLCTFISLFFFSSHYGTNFNHPFKSNPRSLERSTRPGHQPVGGSQKEKNGRFSAPQNGQTSTLAGPEMEPLIKMLFYRLKNGSSTQDPMYMLTKFHIWDKPGPGPSTLGGTFCFPKACLSPNLSNSTTCPLAFPYDPSSSSYHSSPPLSTPGTHQPSPFLSLSSP